MKKYLLLLILIPLSMLFANRAEAAISFTVTQAASSTTNAASYAIPISGSLTPVSGSLYYLFLVNSTSTSTIAPTVTGTNGWNVTWKQEATVGFNTITVPSKRNTLFSAVATSSTAGVITVSIPPGATSLGWSLIQVTGNATTNYTVQVATSATAAATSLTVTLPNAFADANNQNLSGIGKGSNTTTTEGTGFTELSDVFWISPTVSLETNNKLNDTSVDWTFVSTQSGGISIEVAVAASASAFEQSAYRWFANNNSSTVGAALTSVQDASTTLAATGDAFRLRALLHVSVTTSTPGIDNFKLQYASTTPGNCNPAFYSNAAFVDTATSTGEIRYNDNALPANGDLLGATSTDPTHSTDSITNQTYGEANNFTVTSTISNGGDGKWDFSLIDFSAPADTTYCFRVVKSNGSFIATSTLSKIPEITTAAAVTTISCAASTSTTSFGTIDSTAVVTSTPNASTSMSCTGALGCTLSVKDLGNAAGGGAKPGLFKSSASTYLIPSPDAAFNATATLAAGTDCYGIQATTTAAGSGGTLTLADRYLQNGNTVGGLSTTTLAIASSTASSTSREVLITHLVAVGAAAFGGNYTDTITYSCLSN